MTFRFSAAGTEFQYLPTQAIRLVLPGLEDPWGPARMLSLSSSPTDEGTVSVTCKITDTVFKQALARLPPGAKAEAYGPLGAFLLDEERPGVMIAGGIGITPFRGMLRFAAAHQLRGPFQLIYSARTPEELIFQEELEALSRTYSAFRVSFKVTRPADSQRSWAGATGRIQRSELEAALRAAPGARVYVAGLPEMVSETLRLLGTLPGVGEADIDYEVFRGF